MESPITTKRPEIDGDAPPRPRSGAVMRFAAAMAAWGVAFALTPLFAPAIQRANFVFFWVAVIFAAWYAGLVPAVLGAAAAVLAVQYWLVPPYQMFGPLHISDLLTFGIFVGAAATVSALASARAMGGDIEIESTPGAGSTFTLILPLAEAAPVVRRGEEVRPA